MTPMAAVLDELGLDPALEKPLLSYRDLLARWNRVVNLSAVRDPETMVTRHLADSLAVLPWLAPGPLLDVGTGPGLPGIPIALAEPARPVTLLESNRKKVRFLRQVCLELKPGNVSLAETRLEAYDAPAPFTVIICRAFSEALPFWQGVAHLLAPGGQAVAMKGKLNATEFAALTDAGVSCRQQTLQVPGLNAERHLLIMSQRTAE